MKKLLASVLLVAVLVAAFGLNVFAAEVGQSVTQEKGLGVTLVSVKHNMQGADGFNDPAFLTDGERGTTDDAHHNLWMASAEPSVAINDDTNLTAEMKAAFSAKGTNYILFEYSDVATFGAYSVHFMAWSAEQKGVALAQWTVLYSADGKDWKVAEAVTGNKDVRSFRTYDQPIEAKYFAFITKGRVSAQDPANQYSTRLRLSELDFSFPGKVTVTDNFMPINFAVADEEDRRCDAEMQGYSNKYYLVDGTVATTKSYKTTYKMDYATILLGSAGRVFGADFAAAEAIDGYIKFDFDEAAVIGSYDVHAINGKSFNEGWSVYASEDGKTWTKVDTVEAADVAATTTSRTLKNAVTAKSIAICPVAPEDTAYCEITEISFNAGEIGAASGAPGAAGGVSIGLIIGIVAAVVVAGAVVVVVVLKKKKQ